MLIFLSQFLYFCFRFSSLDVALWSTNGTEVDVFLKKDAVDGVRQVLKDNQIGYTVLIDDMQKQIENENPPQEEIEALQNRNGM